MRKRASTVICIERRLWCNDRSPVDRGPYPRPAAGFWHGTTILSVRRTGLVVVASDGQVSLGAIVVKGNARKVHRFGDEGGRGAVLAGFAGGPRLASPTRT